MWLVWRESPGGILLPGERILSILHGQANVLDGGGSHRARAAACGGAQAMGSDVPFLVAATAGARRSVPRCARTHLCRYGARVLRAASGVARGQNRSDDGGSAHVERHARQSAPARAVSRWLVA